MSRIAGFLLALVLANLEEVAEEKRPDSPTEFKERLVRFGGRLLVGIGAVSAMMAAAFGWAASIRAQYPGDLNQILTLHRWTGAAVAGASPFAWILAGRYALHPTVPRRLVYVIVLGGTAGLVGAAGHLGGTLIHGTELFSW